MASTFPQEPGIYPFHNKASGQRFTLSIPEAYSIKPVPLILILHWGGQVTPYYGRSILEGLAAPGA